MKNPTNPKVSILCPTYNHESFIAQALESFIMQETNFAFEIIVGEDCSTDKTKEIVEKYVQKYPNLIKPIYQSVNQGIYKNNADVFKLARGEYFIFCEGDDYFSDKNKLQIQADYLDKNPQNSACFHYAKLIYVDKSTKSHIHPSKSYIRRYKNKLNYETLKKSNFIHTNSCMYRKYAINFDDFFPKDALPADWFIHIYYSRLGKIGFIPKIMSVYRKHSGGIWYFASEEKYRLKYGAELINLYFQASQKFSDDKEFWFKEGAKEFNTVAKVCINYREWDKLETIKQQFAELAMNNPLTDEDLISKSQKRYKKYKKLFKLTLSLSVVLFVALLISILR